MPVLPFHQAQVVEQRAISRDHTTQQSGSS
jgi:hypothetical protein